MALQPPVANASTPLRITVHNSYSSVPVPPTAQPGHSASSIRLPMFSVSSAVPGDYVAEPLSPTYLKALGITPSTPVTLDDLAATPLVPDVDAERPSDQPYDPLRDEPMIPLTTCQKVIKFVSKRKGDLIGMALIVTCTSILMFAGGSAPSGGN